MSAVRILPMESIHADSSLNISRGGRPIAESNVAALADDIRAHGLLEDIGVCHVDNAEWLTPTQRSALNSNGLEWLVIYGFRRFAACSLIDGFLTIRAHDLGPGLTLAHAELANLAENGDREPPTDYDVTVACHRFVTFHKIAPATIAQRSGKSLKFVEDSLAIVAKVSPKLLPFYAANCSRETRRKMFELATIDAASEHERHELQERRWNELEAAEGQERRENPNAGFGPRVGGKKRSPGATVSRTDLRTAAESVLVAREFWNGREWVPATSEQRELALAWIRWVMTPSETMPVR